ncbi:MAG TPA: hypothetical protein VHF51_01945 [Solirubrobacteraceae bacterium]|nr:hypothetical protein [Solirubrobacteraceae bacterium]
MSVPPPTPVSALSGLADARSRLDTPAHNIASASMEPFSPLRPDGTQGAPRTQELAGDIVGSMPATISTARTCASSAPTTRCARAVDRLV